MSVIDRRTFVKGAVVGGAALAGPFQGFLASPAAAKGKPGRAGYGSLRPVADQRDGLVRLELPSGFNYRSFHVAGSSLSDGTTIPARHDGMAAFRGTRRNTSILVRNHEFNGNSAAGNAVLIGDPTATTYDPLTGGGTITVEVDRHGNVLRDWVSLNGTQMNCAGGRTPWGSWITCEETVNGDDVGPDFTGVSNAGLEPHGYIFEVPADGTSNGVPITQAGRFAHEAAAVDPATGIVYLTEDNFGFPSGFYRYLPPAGTNPMTDGHLSDGGTLQMLAVAGSPNEDLSDTEDGNSYSVSWVTIATPDPTPFGGASNNDAIVAVGDQGRALGAADFSRLEGCVYDAGKVFFTSTQGGPDLGVSLGFGVGRGQIWRYDPVTEQLTCVYESPGAAILDLPDNVEASATGTLVLCEDGSGDNFLRGLTRGGEVFDLARNADPAQAGQEFAGATFSPDHKTLFVNIQSADGYSIAIWGPWARGGFA